ncbi:uncharacterized protein LOC108118232 isoform X2 [Drosophila eugracilis]|nr:uncharacterized protein LOC108118232 isoform X2 [Drosophila eugracilis]
MSLIIVELQIISTFALVAISWWADVLTFFAVVLILMIIFLVIGIFLPRKMDLTLDIAVLFIIAFIFLIIATFVLLFELLIWSTIPYAFLVVELAVTFTILFFVMYHGQTINGNRFAEMRLSDFFLGSLILFHDFLIIYWLTFYWQVHYRPITPDSWARTSTPYPGSYYSNTTENRDKIIDTNLGWMDYNNQRSGKGFTRGYDVPYYDNDNNQDRYPSFQEEERKRKGYGNRNRDREDPMDRRRPKDWSVYKPRPGHGFRNQERSQTRSPGRNDIYHRHRNPNEWDPEYITQGIDKDVPFDERFDAISRDNKPRKKNVSFDKHSGDSSRESKDEVEPTHKDRNVPYDYGFDEISRGRPRDSLEEVYQPTKVDIEPSLMYGNAEGKSADGRGKPSIDFPLTNHQPSNRPTTDSSNIYIIPKAHPTRNYQYQQGYENPDSDTENYNQNENLEIAFPPEEVIHEDSSQNQESNLLRDEMKASTEGDFVFSSENAPEWEELSQDELRKLSSQQILKYKEKRLRPKQDPRVEPLVTRDPYPINLSDYEKLVMNVSTSGV